MALDKSQGDLPRPPRHPVRHVCHAHRPQCLCKDVCVVSQPVPFSPRHAVHHISDMDMISVMPIVCSACARMYVCKIVSQPVHDPHDIQCAISVMPINRSACAKMYAWRVSLLSHQPCSRLSAASQGSACGQTLAPVHALHAPMLVMPDHHAHRTRP